MSGSRHRRSAFHPITNRDSCDAVIRFATMMILTLTACSAIKAAVDVIAAGPASRPDTAALVELWPFAYFGAIAVLALRVRQTKSRTAARLLAAMLCAGLLRVYWEYGIEAIRVLPVHLMVVFVCYRAVEATTLWHSKYEHEAGNGPDVPDDSSADSDRHETGSTNVAAPRRDL